ncbi:glycoside hydrolase [Pseudoflavitalea sp. G-6-1-2]|uniref:glycoside hydrolase family 38 N-terminal domain-containing protein n=1 Tax=Pseudoflavitalea sp. G-6-1-2 TaxID=2728841 RepID=UPI00146A0D8D|nr:glycoside hydrolase family 38 C-terminal domain-containing protein [Pseudoflavitalea sp. G-6-1-2]NML23056.1 glycoside hydrolase [Pseudoflavitalea sp. G-6-1-2]
MRKVFALLNLCLLCISASAQSNIPWLGNIKWITGYAHEVGGENIGYFSIYPDHAPIALLTRASDGNKTIEWETAALPASEKGPYVYFSWVAAHSSATSGGPRNFDLYVNDQKLLTFTTQPGNRNPNWTFAAPDSSRLVFIQKKLDGNSDAHGLAFLRLPLTRLTLGKPVKIKVTGQAQQSNDWFMTFKFSFEEKADVIATPFMLKSGKQLLSFTALHFGANDVMDVHANKKAFKFPVKEGINQYDIPVDIVQKTDSILVTVSSRGKELFRRQVIIQPVVHRQLYFVHHSHTDIGYSHLQPEVEKIHNKNIDDALRMIEQTRALPAAARFTWNVESLWAVENYLKQASAGQKEKFIAAVKSGSINLSALYANILTGLSQPEEMFHYTDYAARLKKQYGLDFSVAMTSDVPGFAWSTVSALAKAGVKYFSVGSNYIGEHHPFLGDRAGHFLKAWGDNPVWWMGPDGKEKILFWAGGKGYSSWHGTGPGAVFDRGPQRIATYLEELNKKKYPYEIVQWRYNIVADNGPVDTSISRFVASWNEKYSSPRIVLSTAETMFKDFERRYGKQIPVVKGDISPYWEDGAMSTAEEEGKNRVNSLRLQQLTTLYSMLNPGKYNEQLFYEAWKNILLFHEHTWGAHNSITSPDITFVTEQWRIKKQFMLDADVRTNQLADELMNTISDAHSKIIAVFNTSSFPRTGAAMIRINGSAQSVKAANGKLYPLQKLSNGSFAFIAHDVPALGTAMFELSDEPAPAANQITQTENSLSNGLIKLSWDATDGSITSLTKDGAFNYAGRFNKQGLNSYWYVPGTNPEDATSNNPIKVVLLESGPVLTRVSLKSAAPGANSLERNITLLAGEDIVRIENIIDKKSVRSKEAVHFGFPFNSQLQQTTLDAGYGIIRFQADQLPGSNKDYLYGRRWLDASSTDKGIQLLWIQTPLTEPGTMIDERQTAGNAHKNWKTHADNTSNWFSYVMNNYWHTNYKADQEGKSQYNYALRPHEKVNNAEMEKAAAAFTQPLLAVPVKQGFSNTTNLFGLSNNNIVVTSIQPDGTNAFMVRLFNPEPIAAETSFHWGRLKPKQVIEKQTGKVLPGTIKLAAMEVIELKLEL